MIRVSIIGGGNVAHHLAHIFYYTKGVKLVEVYNRSIKNIESLKKITLITNNLNDLKEVDIFIISVSDEVIKKISTKIPHKNVLLVHTSGSTSIDILKEYNRNGVFYPLQTFSKGRIVDNKTIPFCIESNNNEDLDLLKKLASKITKNVHLINSQQRKKLHIAAVFVNNFVNHLYDKAHDICKENEVSFDVLKPLILETAMKINQITPKNAQTGPARRGDTSTIKKHLKELNNKQQEIYNLLSKSISNNYGKKL